MQHGKITALAWNISSVVNLRSFFLTVWSTIWFYYAFYLLLSTKRTNASNVKQIYNAQVFDCRMNFNYPSFCHFIQKKEAERNLRMVFIYWTSLGFSLKEWFIPKRQLCSGYTVLMVNLLSDLQMWMRWMCNFTLGWFSAPFPVTNKCISRISQSEFNFALIKGNYTLMYHTYIQSMIRNITIQQDPILTAFELSWELRRLSFLEHEFKVKKSIDSARNHA